MALKDLRSRKKRRAPTLTEISFSHRINGNDLAVIQRHIKNVPVKVGALATDLGLKVVLATLPMNISGLIQPEDGDGFVIKINRFESKERQRFTIAHEISHYLLHRDRINAGIIDSVLYRSKLSSRIEAEANRLAADIVMPRQAVSAEMANFAKDLGDDEISDLAEKFQVSKQAMAIRVG